MLHLNKNPCGKLFNFLFGLAEILDGVVRTLSLGFIATKFPLEVSKLQAKMALSRLKRRKA